MTTTAVKKRIILFIVWAIFFHESISNFFASSVGNVLNLVTLWLLSHTPNTPENALWKASVADSLSFSQVDHNFTIDLVVSHCNLPIDWIFEWADPYKFRDVTIFSKCNQQVHGAPIKANIVELPNVGRCDHTYAYYMARHYTQLSNSKKKHVVLFLKDNDNRHRTVYSRHRSLIEMLQITKNYGFACHEDRVWSVSRPSQENSLWQVIKHPVCQLSTYHNWTVLRKKDMVSYVRIKRDRNDQIHFKSTNGDLLGEYADRMGIRLPNILPVCYGGNFMALGHQIQKKTPEKLWHHIEQSLNRGSNVAEGHFAERLWAALLSFPLKKHQIDNLLKQASSKNHPCYAGQSFQGALTKY
jgi:hypothetical protein